MFDGLLGRKSAAAIDWTEWVHRGTNDYVKEESGEEYCEVLLEECRGDLHRAHLTRRVMVSGHDRHPPNLTARPAWHREWPMNDRNRDAVVCVCVNCHAGCRSANGWRSASLITRELHESPSGSRE